jgi:hypothetical protein
MWRDIRTIWFKVERWEAESNTQRGRKRLLHTKTGRCQ